MKVNTLNYQGPGVATAVKMPSKGDGYYCLVHGEHRGNGWQLRIPLGITDFPCNGESPVALRLEGDFGLVPLRTQDPAGNDSYLLVAGSQHTGALVLLDPRVPDHGGELTWTFWGKGRQLMTGYSASSFERRRSPMPVIQAAGPLAIYWKWSNSPDSWEALFDGTEWTVSLKEGQDDLYAGAL